MVCVDETADLLPAGTIQGYLEESPSADEGNIEVPPAPDSPDDLAGDDLPALAAAGLEEFLAGLRQNGIGASDVKIRILSPEDLGKLKAQSAQAEKGGEELDPNELGRSSGWGTT